MTSPIELLSGDLSVTVRPEMGGAVTAFRRRTASGWIDLLRPASEQAIHDGNALDSSSYPLVPYSNRIANGRLHFRGREWRSAPTFPSHPHTLHGQGFMAKWAKVHSTSRSAEIGFQHHQREFPSAYQAVQRFELTDDSFAVELTVKNIGQEAMPAGLGFHPFFPKPPDTRVQVPLDGVWLMAKNDGIPTEHVLLPKDWDFNQLREIGSVVLDHCFTGWKSRKALIEWPSRGLRIQMTGEGPVDFVVIYSPQGQDFVCIEPVTNLNDAFNRYERGDQDTGTVVLEPGQAMTAKMILKVECF